MKNSYKHNDNGTTTIFIKRLGKILEVLISTSKFDLVNAFPNTWLADWDKGSRTYYVYGMLYGKMTTNGKKNQKVYLHRWLTNCPKGLEVNHINFNGLDNSDSNLEPLTHSEHEHKKRPKDVPILGDPSGRTGWFLLPEPSTGKKDGLLRWYEVIVNDVNFGTYVDQVESNFVYNIALSVMNDDATDEQIKHVLVDLHRNDPEYIAGLIKHVRKYVKQPNQI